MANFNAPSVRVHDFSMIPRADIPRSRFRIQTAHKTTFDAGWLIPVYLEEVLPGDTYSLKMTAFVRMATPIAPIMDNLYMDSFFFFVPNRILWNNFKRFMGERVPNPDSSIDFVLPVIDGKPGGYDPCSLGDYFGLPTVGQVTPSAPFSHNALPFRAYNLIWDEWFKDQNLQSRPAVFIDDATRSYTSYPLRRRGKRHDYFTSALPWPQKGQAVALPLGLSAPVKYDGLFSGSTPQPIRLDDRAGSTGLMRSNATTRNVEALDGGAGPGLFADLSQATAATINQLRQSFQIQKLLERDARGGTRYTEIIRSHFGVVSPDARLQRPEYLGGSSTRVDISAVAQTSATVTGEAPTPPLGTLAAIGTAVSREHGFTQSFTEHGYIIGLVSVRADLNYQQGMRKLWSRSTRYDFYFPAFAHLGEQAILNKEIYFQGNSIDNDVFGYQERWSEYRYHPSLITGMFRSTTTGTIDYWHLAQRFNSLPLLSDPFIVEDPPISRVLSAGSAANGQQFIFDSLFDIKAARPMPMYSVPGLIDHF